MNRLNQKVLNAEMDAFVSTSVRTFEADTKAQKNVGDVTKGMLEEERIYD